MRTPDPFAASVEFDDVSRLVSVSLCTEEAVKAAKRAESATLQNEIKKVLVSATPLKPMHWRAVKTQLSDFTPAELTAAMVAMEETGDVTKLTAMGGGKFFLDSEGERRKRVAEAVDTASYKTVAALADASSVATDWVKRAIKARVLLFEGGRFSMPKAGR